MSNENVLPPTLQLVKKRVYDQCACEVKNITINAESKEYEACSFELNGQKVEHRTSKITPTKTGQFVTIWKRNKLGITEPFNSLDDIEYLIITSKSGNLLGQFIFPKSILIEKGIITHNGKDGKRGMRVYPTWDSVMNKQAEKTQAWQSTYFVEINKNTSTNLQWMKKMLEHGQ